MGISDSPYRIHRSSAAAKCPPAELVYKIRDPERHVAATRALLQVGAGGAIVGSVLYVTGLEAIAAVVFTVTLAWAFVRWRRAPDLADVVLRVDDGFLEVMRRPSQMLLLERTGNVANVALDTKTIRRVQEGNALTPSARFVDSRVGPELDVARIVFDVHGIPEPLRLSEAYVAHMECIEWLGKIRFFLRSHGWVPEDERDDGDAASNSENDNAHPREARRAD
jgi:hypothetical protein